MTKVTIDRELLPCPFCGGDPEASPEYQHNPGCYFDALASFKAAAQDFDFSLAPEVLKAWNRRAAPAPVAEPASPWLAVSEWIEEAFQFGFNAPVTYNDVLENDVAEAWEKERSYLLRPLPPAPESSK